MSKSIELTGVTKTYQGATQPTLHPTDFVAVRGEFTVIIGPSGCGKSTFSKLIVGLEEPTAGTIVRPERIAMVFQSGALLPWLTAAQNIATVLEVQGMPQARVRRRVHAYLEMVGLSGRAEALPRELSGGQRQRVGVARALAVEPELLVLDEPFAALDIKATELLHQDLLTIWQKTSQTVLMVSHSIEEAVTLADRVVLMNAGRIVRSYDLADLPRPRRERADSFIEQVQSIRRDFLALGD